MPTPPIRHVAVRCDAGGKLGVGHAVRCLALGQELRHRGVSVTVLGSIGVPWVAALAADSGILILPAPTDPDGLVDAARTIGADAVVLDGYAIDPRTGAALRAAGVRVLAMVDGEFGAAQDADIYVDQNLGAAPPRHLPKDAVALAGLDYALLRDSVLDRRGRPRPHTETPRCLTVFGGTDPYAAGAVILPLLLATGVPVDVTAITPDSTAADRLRAQPVATGQSLTVVSAIPDLPAIAVESDVVITASGSSVWELLCLGVPTGVVCVTANQRLGYASTIATGAALAVGELDALRHVADARDAATRQVAHLLTNRPLQRELSAAGRRLIDGLGRARVADRLLAYP